MYGNFKAHSDIQTHLELIQTLAANVILTELLLKLVTDFSDFFRICLKGFVQTLKLT